MLPIIPTPRTCREEGTYVTLDATCVAEGRFAAAAKTLCDLAARACRVSVSCGEKGAIRFLYRDGLPEEGYTLTVTAEGATLYATDPAGAQNGAATLLQLIEPGEDGRCRLPLCEIEDAPECSFRGIMVDLARNFHPYEMLYQYVDLCRFYKVKYLHLHFTDDQSYTLPSRVYPKLSTPGRSYSEEEIRALIAYATARGVEIIPEIDTPGHTTSFAAAYGDLFGTHKVLCLSDESMAGIGKLFRELCDLFAPSAYIHIGGDEAEIIHWTTCEKCREAFRRRGVDVDGTEGRELAEIMYATYIKEACEIVLACGKTPVVWEGFAEKYNDMIPRQALIVSWENLYQTTPSLQKAGFRLLNCSWAPMYVVTPRFYWPLEEVYGWDVYTWRAIHPQSPYRDKKLTIAPTAQVEGGELLAWGDGIGCSYTDIAEGVRQERRLMIERTPALAENTWTREKRCDFPTWQAALAPVAEKCDRLLGCND